MKISIVIPTYNCGQYLEKAILSVLNQPYENKELIVIDGNSTDNTLEILEKYKDRLKWVLEKDSGQAEAINKGFKMSSGEIVTWLNADDYYEPVIFNYIAKEFNEDKNIVLVYGNCRNVDKKRKEIKINFPPEEVSVKKLISNGNYIYQPSSFYLKKTLREIGFINENLNYWMEYDLYIKLLKKGSGKYIDRILSNFMIREDQKSNKKNREKMNKELITISRKHGGTRLSKIYFSTIIHKIISFFRK
jgi:glycosyltransferase involved in cell wall biosynthesis